MTTTKYTVEYVEPGDQFIEPGSEEVMNNTGVDVKVGKLENGCWVSWIPYYEAPHRDYEPIRAVATNKHVAAGSIQEHYHD